MGAVGLRLSGAERDRRHLCLQRVSDDEGRCRRAGRYLAGELAGPRDGHRRCDGGAAGTSHRGVGRLATAAAERVDGVHHGGGGADRRDEPDPPRPPLPVGWFGVAGRNVVYYLLASAVFRDGISGVFAFGGVLGARVYWISQADVLLFGVAARSGGVGRGRWRSARRPRRVQTGHRGFAQRDGHQSVWFSPHALRRACASHHTRSTT